MSTLKHLPVALWTAADREAFANVYARGDIFDETEGPGAHLSAGTRRIIETAYRRWLGFLSAVFPADLAMAPKDRITPGRVRAFVERLQSEVRTTTAAHVLHNLGYAARLIAPSRDWRWLTEISKRLTARAERLDRFDRLVPPVRLLDFAVELMDIAMVALNASDRRQLNQYRDGLIIAFLSLWPIRRRSIAALTVSHLRIDDSGITIQLSSADTKARRNETGRLPVQLVPYLEQYVSKVRPELLVGEPHDGLWPSQKGASLSEGRIYDIVRDRIRRRFDKEMGLHDMRRAAATYIAIDMPDKVGLIPGVLQQANPEIGEQHYNLSNAMSASRRYAATLATLKANLRTKASTNGDPS